MEKGLGCWLLVLLNGPAGPDPAPTPNWLFEFKPSGKAEGVPKTLDFWAGVDAGKIGLAKSIGRP